MTAREKKSLRNGLSLLFVLFISSCSLLKEPAESSEIIAESLPANLMIPDDWVEYGPDTNEVSTEWYEEFQEPQLNDLVKQALDTTNPGIVFRMARIEESLAEITLARSGRQVFLDYGVNYIGNVNESGSMSNVGIVGLPVSWEADLWGRIKAGMLAADENMLSEVHQYDFTRQAIAGNVARLYFQIGAIKRSLEIGNEFKSINERLIEVNEKREEVGISDAKDVHLSRANVAAIAGVIEDYENRLQLANRNLEILMGDYPQNALDVQWEPKGLQEVVYVKDPLSLIGRRPDLRALENQVRGAFFLSQQAELAKYPSLVLSANPGLGTDGFAMTLGASLFGPIFNGREIQSRIEIASARQKQVLSLYGSAILEAFNEVESSLKAEEILSNRLAYATEVAEESRQAYEIAVEQYKVGQHDLYYTLLLQSQYLLAELAVIDINALVYLQRVQLYQSLGGNIEPY